MWNIKHLLNDSWALIFDKFSKYIQDNWNALYELKNQIEFFSNIVNIPVGVFIILSTIGTIIAFVFRTVRRDKLITALDLPQHQILKPEYFTGRKEKIFELKKALLENKNSGSVALIKGMGGIGKTYLARQVASNLISKRRFKKKWFSRYIDLRGFDSKHEPMLPTEALNTLLRSFGHIAKELPKDEYQLAALWSHITKKQKIILILDNVHSDSQLKHLLPKSSDCMTIVVSRNILAIGKVIDLGKMTVEDASKLALKIANTSDPKRLALHQANSLAKLCLYHPLAINVASWALAKHNIWEDNVEEYLCQLADEASRRGKLKEVYASLALSLQAFNEEECAQFYALAVFTGEFDIEAIKAVWQISETHDTLANFVSSHLLEFKKQSRRYYLHDFIREFAIDEELKEWETICLRHAEHYLNILKISEYGYKNKDPQGLALFDIEQSNIISGHAWSVFNADKNKKANAFTFIYPIVGSDCLRLRLPPKNREKWLKFAFKSIRRIKNKDFQCETAQILCDLGTVYFDLGQFDRAFTYYKRAMVKAIRIQDIHMKNRLLSNFGVTYKVRGDTQKAIECYNQAMKITTDPRAKGNLLCNLGNCYASIGQTEAAIGEYNEAIALLNKSGDSFEVGNVLESFAKAFIDKQYFGKAIEYATQGVDIAKNIGSIQLGSETNTTLAVALLFSGEVSLAHTAIKKALEYDYKLNNAYANTVYGVITLQRKVIKFFPLYKRHFGVAKAAFSTAITKADTLLSYNKRNFEALDAKAIAIGGLAYCNNTNTKVTLNKIDAYQEARNINNDLGVITRTQQLFSQLP